MNQILIIGAGASGLLTAVKLLQAGRRDFLILERSDRLGGTWRDNIYPGVACDVPSHLYSFSFEANPDWSEVYAPQAEILQYLEKVAHKYGLIAHIRFASQAREARFRGGAWEVLLESGETLKARYLFHGGGGLEQPAYPDIPGLADFGGTGFHSARWRRNHDLSGRIAVIGSAASAIQLLPHLARQASQVYLFQRTPNWVVPKHNRLYANWEKALFRNFPALARLYRQFLFHRLEWSFGLMQKNSWMARLIERWALRRMGQTVHDERLQALLTPTYPMGCKRILLSNDFYPTLTLANVEVVGQPIARAIPEGLVGQDGRKFEVDTLVYATGFRVFATRVAYYGDNGQSLNELLQQGPEAYKGMTLAGFPNLFLLLGPNSALGHNSVWLMAEAQADCAIAAIEEVERRRAQGLAPRQSAQDSYNRELERRFKDLVWSGGCQSWYQTPAGKNFTIFPGNVREYQRLLASEDWRDYEFF